MIDDAAPVGTADALPAPVQPASGMDFEKAAVVRRELDLDGLTVRLPLDFDDPVFSRQVLGLQD